MKKPLISTLTASLIFLSGCATTTSENPSMVQKWKAQVSEKMKGNKEKIGTGVGAVIGAALLYKLTGGNKELAVLLGSVIGGLIGRDIGKYLDEKDQALHAQSIQESFKKEVGEKATWHNPESENRGKLEVVNAYQKDDQVCKKVKSIITTSNGLTDKQTITGCKDKDGGWTLVG